MSILADLYHREATRPVIGEWLERLELEPGALSDDQWAVMREARRQFDRAVRVPSEFVARKAELDSRAYHVWVRARENNDFARFAPLLQEQLDASLEEASYVGYEGERAYDYWIDKHDPGLTANLVDALFTPLLEELPDFVQEIVAAPEPGRPDLLKGLPVEGQKLFLNAVTRAMGFDYARGRMDVAVHPFCSGTVQDTRLTTRYDVKVPLESIYSAIHEAGHGLYCQGLSEENFGNALGEDAGMAMHESQSRLWENQVGRSREFWQYWEPEFRKIFGNTLEKVSSEDLYRAVNAVELNPIRVQSDEVTYNLHILLRFEIEKQLFNGQLEVKDLPAAWNELSQQLLKLTPKDDREGVLQDVHWSGGAFGYFPSYCLGNMIAAQLWYAALEQVPGVEVQIGRGQMSGLLQWLRDNIHQQGRRYDAFTLTEKITGQPLSHKDLMRYLRERYGQLFFVDCG